MKIDSRRSDITATKAQVSAVVRWEESDRLRSKLFSKRHRNSDRTFPVICTHFSWRVCRRFDVDRPTPAAPSLKYPSGNSQSFT